MDIDLILAIAHHLAVFTLVALFAAEFALLRPGLAGPRIGNWPVSTPPMARWPALVIVVGILRVIFGAAGWQYYVGNQMLLGQDGRLPRSWAC